MVRHWNSLRLTSLSSEQIEISRDCLRIEHITWRSQWEEPWECSSASAHTVCTIWKGNTWQVALCPFHSSPLVTDQCFQKTTCTWSWTVIRRQEHRLSTLQTASRWDTQNLHSWLYPEVNLKNKFIHWLCPCKRVISIPFSEMFG